MLLFIPQGRQVVLDDRVERGVLRLMALVVVARADRVLGGKRIHQSMMYGEVARS